MAPSRIPTLDRWLWDREVDAECGSLSRPPSLERAGVFLFTGLTRVLMRLKCGMKSELLGCFIIGHSVRERNWIPPAHDRVLNPKKTEIDDENPPILDSSKRFYGES